MPAAEPNGRFGEILGGRYRIVRRLDAGGMGSVYEAEHLRLHRRVAVKVLADHLAEDRTALCRFENEAQALAQLDHPHVVRVVDFDLAEGSHPFLVMELLRGKTLGQLLEDVGALDLDRALSIAGQIGSALIAAHSAGIVHRDLKPDNVFLVAAAGGLHVKVLDFGVSRLPGEPVLRLTLVNEVIGTPEYMAPEQAMGQRDRIGVRTDQHALALIVYQMLSGVSPFEAPRSVDSLLKVVHEDPPLVTRLAPHLPSSIGDVVRQALSKRPAERFDGIDRFIDALFAAVRRTPSCEPAAPVPSAREQPRSMSAANTAPVDVTRTVVALVERIRAAESTDDSHAAVAHAKTIMNIIGVVDDPALRTVVELSRPTLERVFERYLRPLDRIIVVDAPMSSRQSVLSHATAYLVSRIDGGFTIDNALDVAGMPRMEALHALIDLEQAGVIRFHRDSLVRCTREEDSGALRVKRGAV